MREHPARGTKKRAFETPTLEITGALLAAAIRPNPEVAEKPQRRRFTAEYKIRILREADACAEPGEIGALLRREGLHCSHLTEWRRQREQGAWAALAPKPPGRRGVPALHDVRLDRMTSTR